MLSLINFLPTNLLVIPFLFLMANPSNEPINTNPSLIGDSELVANFDDPALSVSNTECIYRKEVNKVYPKKYYTLEEACAETQAYAELICELWYNADIKCVSPAYLDCEYTECNCVVGKNNYYCNVTYCLVCVADF